MKKIMRAGRTALAALLLLVVTISLVSLVLPVASEPVDTYHSSWQLIRETAVEDGATFAAVYALATAEGDFAGKDSSTVVNGGPFQIGSVRSGYGDYGPGAMWQFVICGGEAENDTFSFNLVGWTKDNGMLQNICEGDGVIGTQDVVLYPDDSAAATDIWWADTINIDDVNNWPKQRGNLTSVASYNSGNNQVAILAVETEGLEWIQFIFYDCNGGGTEANDITVYGRRF